MMRVAGFVCSCLIWGLVGVSAEAQTRAIEDAVGRGITAYFRGQNNAAEQALTAAVDAGSRDPQALFFRGLARWQLGRTDEARADFSQGAQLEAASPGMFRTSARSLERVQGAPRLALQQARQTARVAVTARREKERLARFDLQTGKRAEGEVITTPPMTVATTPAATSVDPFAPKQPAAPTSTDPFAVPKPAMTPMPVATTPVADPFSTKSATPSPAPPMTASAATTTPAVVTAPITLPDDPAQIYVELFQHASNGRADVVWQMLPAKHQADITSVIREFGAKMDQAVWEKSFTLLGKMANVIKSKRALIVGHPAVAQALSTAKINDQSATPEQIQQALEIGGTMMQTLFTSEIATVAGLKQFDPPAFLNGTASKLLLTLNDAAVQISGKTKEEALQEALSKTKTSANKRSDDEIEVIFETQGAPPATTVWKKVDGKWLPAVLVDDWDEKITQAKAAIAAMDFSGPQAAQVTGVLSLIEPVVDQLNNAADQDAFNGVINGFLPLVQGMLGGLGGM